LHGRAVIHERNDRGPDILFNGFEQRFADQGGAAEQWIDMDKEGYVRIMVAQTEDLQDILGGFTSVTQRDMVFFQGVKNSVVKGGEILLQNVPGYSCDFYSCPLR
jgi:hypothetical protein